MRNVLKAVSTAVLVITLVGCGTTVNTSKDDTDKNNSGSGNENSGIVAGSVVPSLTPEGPKENHHYIFELKNDTTEDITLTMTSSQEYEYHLINDKGVAVYTYSADKIFAQMIQEKILKPGETVELEIDASEGLSKLPAGTYTLEVNATANEGEYKASAEIDYDGHAMAAEGEKLNVQEANVTFEGLQDSNSIEVINEQNVPEAMRLTEASKPFFNDLERGTKITVFYVEIDGQKVIQDAKLN